MKITKWVAISNIVMNLWKIQNSRNHQKPLRGHISDRLHSIGNSCSVLQDASATVRPGACRLTFTCIMWLCSNINKFVLYITMDKFYIPWSHVITFADWMNMNKEVEYWIKLPRSGTPLKRQPIYYSWKSLAIQSHCIFTPTRQLYVVSGEIQYLVLKWFY